MSYAYLADRQAVHAAVRSYRPGAPISLEDVRIACRMDGHPVDHLSRSTLSSFVREVCEPEEGRYGASDYRIYRWSR